MSHKLQFRQFQFFKQDRAWGSTPRPQSSWTAEAHRDRQTCSHVIGPLNDIIAENLGQRGWRAGELACRVDTRPQLQYGYPADIGSSEVEASCAAEAFSHFASFIMHQAHQAPAKKSHRFVWLENLLIYTRMWLLEAGWFYIDQQFATPQ